MNGYGLQSNYLAALELMDLLDDNLRAFASKHPAAVVMAFVTVVQPVALGASDVSECAGVWEEGGEPGIAWVKGMGLMSSEQSPFSGQAKPEPGNRSERRRAARRHGPGVS